MPLNIPENDQEIKSRGLADVQRELSQSNPFGKNHWLKSIAVGCLKAIFDFYQKLKFVSRENFPDTAVTTLDRWAAIYVKSRLEAKKSTGNVVATGTSTTLIPDGTVISLAGVGDYETTSDATISTQVLSVVDLERSGSTVTASFSSDHGLASSVSVTVDLASNTEFNGTYEIIVNSPNQFQYEIIGTPPDEIGTSATASFTTALIPIESQGFGSSYNLEAGTKLNLQSAAAGVDDKLTVSFGTISGGADEEEDQSLRSRTLEKTRNPTALFNVAAIREKCLEISGVTRVFVQEVTPSVGQVTVYFMRDNETNPIPTGSNVLEVKENILTIKPATTSDVDVIVSAPTAVATAFTFTSITPSTSTMRSAITANLRQFFDEETQVAVNVDEDAYRSAIKNTVDTVTGDRVSDFVLSVPSGDIAISTGQIGTLGTVTFP